MKSARHRKVQSRRDLRGTGEPLIDVSAGPFDGVDYGFIRGGAGRVGTGQHIFGDEAVSGVSQLARGEGLSRRRRIELKRLDEDFFAEE